MTLFLCLAIAALVPTAALGQIAPPVVFPSADYGSETADRVVLFEPVATATCDGASIEARRAEPLAPGIQMRPPSGPVAHPPRPDHLTFSIDAEGRPHNIRQAAPHLQGSQTIGSALGQAAQASLLGWRFEPVRRDDCRLDILETPFDLEAAPTTLVARARTIGQLAAPNLRAALTRRLERTGDDCRQGPSFRTRVSPSGVRPASGQRAWVTARYDVDAGGRVEAVELLDASPDAEITEAALEAVRQSEHTPGAPRRGCLAILSRYGPTATMDMDAVPDAQLLNRCTPEQRARFKPAELQFPPVMLDRGVEGWALVRYDVASWGVPGPIEVLQAEPAQVFGDQARNIIAQGRAQPAFEHLNDCVDRVFFRLPETRTTADED